MGFHECHLCDNGKGPKQPVYPQHSSGDVTLAFRSGTIWVMPDMILHYVADHGWVPPTEFVTDVMESELAAGHRVQYRSFQPSSKPIRVGYLTGDVIAGAVPEGFVHQLERLMQQARQMGMRDQSKGGG